MNTQNSFTPNGLPDEQKPKNRSNVYIAVFAILAFHVVLLGALLLQGCKDKPSSQFAKMDTQSPFANPAATNAGMVDPFAPAPAPLPGVVGITSNTLPVVVPAPVMPAFNPAPPLTADAGAVPTATTGIEHTVAKGDSFYTIAKKYGVLMTAIAKVNPTVDSKKLQIGQKIKIPEKAVEVAGAKTTAETAAPAAKTSNDNVYVVKKGDSLTKISKTTGVSAKQIKSANRLATDMIREGQKLKIPVKTAALEPAALPVSAPAMPAGAPVVPAPSAAADPMQKTS